MKLRISLKIAIIGLIAFFSLSSLTEAQRVVIKQVTDTFSGLSLSNNPSISSDGTKVVFNSNGDFTGSNNDHNQEIFLYDITTGKFTRIKNIDVSQTDRFSINADGSKIAFESAVDITGYNGDKNREIFLATIQESFPYVLFLTHP